MPVGMRRIGDTVVSTSNKRSRATTSKVVKRRKPRDTKIVRCIGYAFPPMLECDMFYSEVVNLSLLSGALATYKWRCNSVFDPNQTAVGNVPLYFPVLSSIYNHYTVISSTIELQMTTPGQIQTAVTAVLYQDDDAVPASNMYNALARPKRKAVTFNTFGSANEKLFTGWSAATTFGNAQPWTDPELQATATTNPAEESFYILQVEEAGSQSFALTTMVTMRFRVMWDELKTLSAT